MSSLFERHCQQDLVRHLDGELTAARAGKVECHLESCGQCRAELEELRNTLADCVSYRNVRAAQLPEAPQPWGDLYRDFSRIDESLANTSLLVRLMRPLVHSGAPRWSFATGLAALVVLGLIYQLRQAPSVQAATLLRKAVAVSESKVRPAHRIRVRTSRQQEFTRLTGTQAAVMQVVEAQTVAALFAAAHYDWNDPLSAHAFQQWRDQQARKTDEVTAVSQNLTRIRTVAAEGELASASITFNTEDYAPVEERLEFRDQEWIELSEVAETSTDVTAAVRPHVDAPLRAIEAPSRPAASTPKSSASITDELQVMSELSAIGADLGDWVEVSLADGKVMVTGEGITPGRQSQIRERLSGMPNVEVEFSPVRPAVVPAESAVAGGSTANASPSPIQARLQKQLGGHAEFDRFSNQLLDMDDAAMQRVYALRRLAQKFSPDAEAALSRKDLNLLHELTRKHTAVLAEKVSGMEGILVPTLNSLGGTAASVHAVSHSSWQPAAEDVFKSARRVEVLVSQMLGMTPGSNASAGALPSELLGALNDLQSSLTDCQKFLPAR